MQTYKLVLPEHLNHGGFLFGGNLLKWVDEAGYMAARLDLPIELKRTSTAAGLR